MSEREPWKKLMDALMEAQRSIPGCLVEAGPTSEEDKAAGHMKILLTVPGFAYEGANEIVHK